MPPPLLYGYSKKPLMFWFERSRFVTLGLLRGLPAGANFELTHAGGLESMNGPEWFQGYTDHEALHH